MAIKIVLDGQRLPGHDIKVSASLRIDTDDLSGQGNSTADADTGHKPQTMQVRLMVKQSDPDQLRLLRNLAGKLDEFGARHIFTIVNDTAEAMDIRQVSFTQEFNAKEDDRLKVWRVSFVLKEHRSVAEKQQEQQDAKALKEQEQSAEGQAVAAAETGEAAEKPLTWIEQKMQRTEDWLSDEDKQATANS